MKLAILYRVLQYSIAAVWFINGLFCKVLHVVPRHEEIVARILGQQHAHAITMAIGWAEMGMAVWICSGIQRRMNILLQVLLISVMNILESILAPDLLLWSYGNLVFAAAFIFVICIHEFRLRQAYLQSQ